MRALRYNESFTSISFANIQMDSLNGLHDNYGREFVCTRTKNGTLIKMSHDELAQSCLLKQEVRALAVTNRKLRRLDFSSCITTKPKTPLRVLDDSHEVSNDPGCAIVEALLPLCRHQTTNVDWICLNGIALSEADLDYLVGAAVDKACHFRAIELNRCGLTDRSVGLILDALRAQDNTLEAIELAGNTARIEPSTFDSQLSVFGFIRKLDLSYVSRTSGPEPLLQADTLLVWRLSDLRFSGTMLNAASVDALAVYLAHPNSRSLRELHLDNTQLTGGDVATLLQCMTKDMSQPREMHLDVSANNVCKGLELLTHTISSNLTPSHLSMRAVDYREESQFRKMLAALTVNKTTQYLNMSQTALPGDLSTESCRALGKMIASNDTILELNISGDDSRLASSKFGSGITEALVALGKNKSLRTLHVERQSLGFAGASALAEALRSNNTLQELFCDNNEIPLHGLTDLVNSLIENTTLIYLPTMDDGRAAAFKSAEWTMKNIPRGADLPPTRASTSPRSATPNITHSPVKRGLASVRKSAQRTASAYTPSFPALQSYSRAASNPLPPVPTQVRSRQGSDSGLIPSSLVFTVQDIQTTQRLLTEQWDRQCYRLARYLERNWCLLNNIPVPMEVEDEKFERPESAGSLVKMLEQVKFDTTPRAEKDAYFEATEQHPKLEQKTNGKSELSFKQFVLGSRSVSPVSSEDGKQLGVGRTDVVECRTPTQPRFTL
ncbi:hypothetical protein AMS68_005059 [Peltaster fructicola]|uniref:Uncharacterized protein n=1 Tax=Peltaster fructicola TaxID=286661 RepID=A0A6H0XXP8_9PEZI|nr:hypothetical protein AMS68_005059 [Peltaster fructicola]